MWISSRKALEAGTGQICKRHAASSSSCAHEREIVSIYRLHSKATTDRCRCGRLFALLSGFCFGRGIPRGRRWRLARAKSANDKRASGGTCADQQDNRTPYAPVFFCRYLFIRSMYQSTRLSFSRLISLRRVSISLIKAFFSSSSVIGLRSFTYRFCSFRALQYFGQSVPFSMMKGVGFSNSAVHGRSFFPDAFLLVLLSKCRICF